MRLRVKCRVLQLGAIHTKRITEAGFHLEFEGVGERVRRGPVGRLAVAFRRKLVLVHMHEVVHRQLVRLELVLPADLRDRKFHEQ